MPSAPSPLDRPVPSGRELCCNRTLNFRSLRAVGYDMDYTLIHYKVEEWERSAFEFIRGKLGEQGWDVEPLRFDPDFVIRGLIIDTELGNIVKANRFGYVKRVVHGTRFLSHDEQREMYRGTFVDLSEPRWRFLNTFFSLSEACVYAQLVDQVDAGRIPEPLGYSDLHALVRTLLNETHVEGELKARIVADPDRYVVLDEEAPRALLDQREAGKKLLLITNSEWSYTREMMGYAFDRFLPGAMTWRDLFHVIVVGARKPEFFLEEAPLFEITDESGLLRPVVGVGSGDAGGPYLGGNARLLEQLLALDGSEILFVGDHIYSDVHISKAVRRWRTAVIVRELEEELAALQGYADQEKALVEQMERKIALEYAYSQRRLELQRRRHRHAASVETPNAELQAQMEELRRRLVALDEEIAPYAAGVTQLHNERWGLLMRTGNDKSYLARQVERHADVYTSRVSNFLFETPFVYLRSHRGSLPHDPV